MTDKKVVLDLCGGTGAWSKPYSEAGYDVKIITIPEHDVLTYKPPKGVYGILAAPPCTEFSIARQDSTAKRKRDLMKGMETVEACYRIIKEAQREGWLKFWALENPASGYLRYFLGKPALVFQPIWFGDRHTKKTALWGKFNEPAHHQARFNFGDQIGNRDHGAMQPIPEGYKLPPDMNHRQVRRSITPPGFAKAFMEANR